MKKIILPIFFLFLSSVSQADSLKMSTILKPPINTFNRLQLIQRTNFNPIGCTDGTVFLDASSRNVMVCNNETLFTMSSPWTQSGNIIYLNDWANSAVKVGVGTTTPSKKLEVSRATTNFVGKINSIQIDTLDNQQNLGINIITRGAPNPLGNWAAFINFNIIRATSGRIVYADRRNAAGVPWGRSGLGIASVSNTNISDIWMDAQNGNVGIGVGAVAATQALDLANPPAAQLEVKNGDLKVNKIYLTALNGSQTAEFKTSYTAGGYYAVLAP